MQVLTLDKISKRFGDVDAVHQLSLEVEEGTILGFLGPNGAGKTTTIRMIMRIIMPDEGAISLFGELSKPKLLDQIGYMPEERGLYKNMRAIELLVFFAEMKGLSARDARQEAEKWLSRLELAAWNDKKVEDLSKGMQQKIQFAATVLHKPRLIILDEPFSGLDPVNTLLLKDIMLDLKKNGHTILFSTHQMESAEKLCETICLVNRGNRVLYGTLADIKRQFGSNRVRLRYDGKADFLDDKRFVDKYDDYGQYVEISPASGIPAQKILEHAVQQVTVYHFELADPSLNEIFIEVITKS